MVRDGYQSYYSLRMETETVPKTDFCSKLMSLITSRTITASKGVNCLYCSLNSHIANLPKWKYLSCDITFGRETTIDCFSFLFKLSQIQVSLKLRRPTKSQYVRKCVKLLDCDVGYDWRYIILNSWNNPSIMMWCHEVLGKGAQQISNLYILGKHIILSVELFLKTNYLGLKRFVL